MSVVLLGSTSGSITLQEPAVAGTNTVNFGANTGVAILDANTPAFRNRIINGAMVIDQRNAGASVTITTDNTFTLDRWSTAATAASKFSVQQSSTAATGFTNSLLATSLSAYSVAAGDIFALKNTIEGFNVSDLGWGTASAQTVTVSFWVRSSLTGTFGGALQNGAQNRSYPFSFTISAANTFEYKTVTIAGDTSGTWLTNNGKGLLLWINLGTGSTGSGTAGAWASAAYWAPTGATSVVGTNGATFYITGVQLEKGSTATSFDYRPYGTELALCQRYYQRTNSYMGVGASGTTLYGYLSFITQMRASPTLSSIGGALYVSDGVAADYNQSSTSVAINSSRVSVYGLCYEAGNFSGMTSYRSYFSKQDYAGGFAMSAEL
jgi:hypothetical protein